MSTQQPSPYAAASSVPLIKSPSLRVPKAVEMPIDIHPLPDNINAYFVYPFTLEPHVITLESSRRATLAARAARHDAYLRARADEKEQRTRERLKLVAPGFEPSAGPLIPTRTSLPSQQQEGQDARTREKDVMDELVEQLAKMESREEKPS